ncbi:MAG: CHAD domain-containing protein [Mucilaginibacter sp.]|uniref:CHAD domain-containing protein n=1 Tax=Mucilaginibacter sp. TaxID=1882438 RepID=UPI0034E4F0AE
MKKKKAMKQLNKLWKGMKLHLKTFLETNSQDDLHQFRVHIKKLKALLTLYASEQENKGLLHEFKPVKTVFKAAGEIRNAYINLQLGEKHQLQDENFDQHQQQILQQGTARFKSQGKSYLKRLKKAHIALQNNLHKLQGKTIRNFYKEKLNRIAVFFAAPTFDEEMHTARKNSKLLIYNQKASAGALHGKLQVNTNYLNQLQDKIGQWHDHLLTMEVLSAMNQPDNQAIINLKNSNAALELEILEQSANFREKVTAPEDAAIKIVPETVV